MKKIALAAAAVVTAGSIASAQQRPAAAQAPAQGQAQGQAVVIRTVGTLVSSGFNIVSVIGHPTEPKHLIVTLQKAGDAYFCPVVAVNPLAMAGGCIKAQ
jgi:hypothetical protein